MNYSDYVKKTVNTRRRGFEPLFSVLQTNTLTIMLSPFNVKVEIE